LTENQAKPLLKVGGKPIVEHIIEKTNSVEEIDEIFIVTNSKFYDNFKFWLNDFAFQKKITLVNDGTSTNETRLGAVGDLNFVLKKYNISEDLLVIAGDNVFGFSLNGFIDDLNDKNISGVAFFDTKDKEIIKNKYGVGVLEGTKIVEFQEKPAEPKSTLAATACYFFTKKDLRLVGSAVDHGYADNTGDLIRYLVQFSEAHGFVFDEHWFDIGSFESLQKADEEYSK
jgi:glucose-1-phosphate thymidylyltransferase